MRASMSRILGRAACVAAAIAAGLFGYDFGRELDGVVLGLVTGANMAILGALLADAAGDWIARRLGAMKREA